MVECEWALLCDYAFLDAQGKMCLIGIFDSMHVQRVPYRHPAASFVVHLRGDPHEAYHVRIEIVRPGGTLLRKLEGNGAVSRQGGSGVVLRLQNLDIPDLGPYPINIYVNDDLQHTSRFMVAIPETHGPS